MSRPDVDWDTAACRDTDPEVFFPDPTDFHGAQFAVSYCRRCPLTAECLAESFEVDARFGVWGGHTEYERSRFRIGYPAPTRAGGVPRVRSNEAQCGTTGGYDRHRRLGEPTCPACRAAKAADQRAYYQRQRGAS